MKIIIDEFIESLKAKQASNNTIVSYERDIMKFSNYFEEKGKKIFDLTRDDMLEYIDYLKSEGKSNPTISRSIASIKRLYKYLLSKNLVEENIVENIESPKVDRKDLMILTQDEIEKLQGYKEKLLELDNGTNGIKNIYNKMSNMYDFIEEY